MFYDNIDTSYLGIPKSRPSVRIKVKFSKLASTLFTWPVVIQKVYAYPLPLLSTFDS